MNDIKLLLVDAAPEKTFYLFNGKPIKNLTELVSELEIMTRDEFANHCNPDKDDFATWIDDALKMNKLSALLKKTKNKEEYIELIKSKLLFQKIKPDIKKITEKKTTSGNSENDKLKKKFEILLENKAKQIEKKMQSKMQSNITNILTSNLANINKQISKITESNISKLEQSFDKKAENISSKNITKLKKNIKKEKQEFLAITSKINKLLNNDEALSKIVFKYQKKFKEDIDRTENIHIESKNKFNNELAEIKNKTLLNSQTLLNKQIADTIKKQRELFDSELTKSLNSNRHFTSRFEKELINKEKLFQESADKKLIENYTKHEAMLDSKLDKHYHDLLNLKLKLDEDIKLKEKQFNELVNSKIKETTDKEFKDMFANQQKELSERTAIAGTLVINRIDSEFKEILSKHKQFIREQSSKIVAEQSALKEKFISDLKSDEEKILFKVKDLMQKELAVTLNKQRDLLDKELTKTILSNEHFVEKFKKEIIDINKKLAYSGDKVFEDNYTKHKKIIQEEYEKKLESIKKLIADADTNIENKKSELHKKLNSEIQVLVKEAINKEFSKLIFNERKSLELELHKAEDNNKNMEKKFEGALQEKAQEIIKTISLDANTRFSEIISLQQQKLDQELLRAKTSHDIIESKKNDIIAKANSFFGNMNTYSANKLKKLEQEHNKHLKKVSQISILITKTKSALNELKELKAEINSNKKIKSDENKEYSQLISELTDLRNNLSQEKNWISTYRAKVNIYNLIKKCIKYIKLKDVNNAKVMYNKIAEAYTRTQFEKKDRTEMYNAAVILSKEIQALVNSP